MRRSSPHAVSIDELSWLAALRPDERERATRHFRIVEVDADSPLAIPAGEPARMGLVLEGQVVLTRAELAGLPPIEVHLATGDRWGELPLFAGIRSGVALAASAPARIALLDEEGFRAIGEAFPVVWLGIAAKLSRELKWKNDLLREIQEFDAQRVDASELEGFLETRRRRVARRRTGVARSATRALYRRLVTTPAREPAWWILLGFLGAIGVSRAVVAAILELHLEKTLFALRDSGGANPIHTHHFTYGFAIMIVAGLLGFFPGSRRFLRPLSLAFGAGLGLVFDEFGLIWNLNPDYYQRLSYEAQAVLAALLVQIVWFRGFYIAAFERIVRRRSP